MLSVYAEDIRTVENGKAMERELRRRLREEEERAKAQQAARDEEDAEERERRERRFKEEEDDGADEEDGEHEHEHEHDHDDEEEGFAGHHLEGEDGMYPDEGEGDGDGDGDEEVPVRSNNDQGRRQHLQEELSRGTGASVEKTRKWNLSVLPRVVSFSALDQAKSSSKKD